MIKVSGKNTWSFNNFIIPPNVNNQKIGSKIKIKNLGKIGSNVKENNWLFNTSQSLL